MKSLTRCMVAVALFSAAAFLLGVIDIRPDSAEAHDTDGQLVCIDGWSRPANELVAGYTGRQTCVRDSGTVAPRWCDRTKAWVDADDWTEACNPPPQPAPREVTCTTTGYVWEATDRPSLVGSGNSASWLHRTVTGRNPDDSPIYGKVVPSGIVRAAVTWANQHHKEKTELPNLTGSPHDYGGYGGWSASQNSYVPNGSWFKTTGSDQYGQADIFGYIERSAITVCR